MSNQNASGRKKGCFFYGCLSLVIIALVLAVFAGIGIYFAKRTVDGLIAEYTAPSPDKIEELVYPAPQMTELRTRVESFQRTVEKDGQPPVELSLTADDLNAMIAANPNLKGKLFVRIDDDQIKGQVSIPLPEVPPLKLKGRYLNGQAGFKVGLRNGQLDVRIDQASVHDKMLPPLILSELRKIDLTREIRGNPEASRVLDRIDSLEVREGKIVIRSKAASTEATPSATTPAAPQAPAPAPAQ